MLCMAPMPNANRPGSFAEDAGHAIHKVMTNTAAVTAKENCLMNRSLRKGRMHNTSAPSAGRKITELIKVVKKSDILLMGFGTYFTFPISRSSNKNS